MVDVVDTEGVVELVVEVIELAGVVELVDVVELVNVVELLPVPMTNP